MHECPVLTFTPDVTNYLAWFELTHQVHVGAGWTAWQRSSLPASGGLEDQPAKLMEALALIAREENALIWKAQRTASREEDQDVRARHRNRH
jgi:hypothetical protein